MKKDLFTFAIVLLAFLCFKLWPEKSGKVVMGAAQTVGEAATKDMREAMVENWKQQAEQARNKEQGRQLPQ